MSYRAFELSDDEAEQFRLCGICDVPLGVVLANFGCASSDVTVCCHEARKRLTLVLSFDSPEISEFIAVCQHAVLFFDSVCCQLCIFDDYGGDVKPTAALF